MEQIDSEAVAATGRLVFLRTVLSAENRDT